MLAKLQPPRSHSRRRTPLDHLHHIRRIEQVKTGRGELLDQTNLARRTWKERSILALFCPRKSAEMTMATQQVKINKSVLSHLYVAKSAQTIARLRYRRYQRKTHSIPAAAGPIALARDIQVMAIPFAAPL